MLQDEVRQIVAAIPGICAVRMLGMNGMGLDSFYYDTPDLQREIALDREGDWIAPMSAASLTLLERVAAELRLGTGRYAVVQGYHATHVLMSVGDTGKWLIALVIEGQPGIDAAIGYLKARSYLADILPDIERTFAIEKEIQHIVGRIYGTRWLRIISVDGVRHPLFRYEADAFKYLEERNREEDRLTAIAAGMVATSERIATELRLGAARYVVVAGADATQLMLRVGDSGEWILSLCIVNGRPETSKIIGYFKAHNYLAHILPLL